MLLSIIILNYKKSALTIRCLESLYQYHEKEFSQDNFELIIVDNASGDDSVSKIREEISNKAYKNIEIIENSENYGFGKGCNIGSFKSRGEYLLFLNNDTVLEDTGIMRMVNCMQNDPGISILGGQLLDIDGKKQVSSGNFYNLFNAFLLLLSMQRFGILDKSPKKQRKVDWVKGGLMMVRKEVFQKLSGFDENMFMYLEDMEFCFRAHIAGFNTYFYPDIRVLHQDQGSSDRSFAIVQIYKGLLYFYKKHKSRAEYSIIRFMLYMKAYIAIFIGIITGNKYLTTTFRKAIKF